jgi:hypothetical protein
MIYFLNLIYAISGVFFKFDLIPPDVEESFVNALYGLRITNQLFKSYIFTWYVHSRLFNAYFEVKFKKTPVIIIRVHTGLLTRGVLLNFYFAATNNTNGSNH